MADLTSCAEMAVHHLVVIMGHQRPLLLAMYRPSCQFVVCWCPHHVFDHATSCEGGLMFIHRRTPGHNTQRSVVQRRLSTTDPLQRPHGSIT